MALCDILIDANIQAKCDNPFYGGYKPIGWIINKDDIEEFEKEGNILNALTLKEGKQSYQIQSVGTQPTATTQTFVKGNYYNKWNIVVNVALLDHGADIIESIITPMSSGARFVVILEHQYTEQGGGENKPMFEVFGLAKGLQLQDGASREEYNEDLNGGWNLPLEENGAPTPSYFINNRTIVDGLKTPAI